MSKSSISPKLLLQFYKDEKVPQLARKKPDSKSFVYYNNSNRGQDQNKPKKSLTSSLMDNYFQTNKKTTHNKNSQQNVEYTSPPRQYYEHQFENNHSSSRDKYQNSPSPSHSNSPPFVSSHPPIPSNKLRKTFEQRKYQEQQNTVQMLTLQNTELKSLTKQLNQRSKQLKFLNTDLQQRINQLQNTNQQLQNERNLQKNMNDEYQKKIRNRVYQQLSFYMRDAVSLLTDQLANQKMSPLVENKIESFLEIILNLNDVSVTNNHIRNLGTKSKGKDFDNTIQNIISEKKQSRLQLRNRSNSTSPINKYQTVLQKLNTNHNYHDYNQYNQYNSSVSKIVKMKENNDQSKKQRNFGGSRNYHIQQQKGQEHNRYVSPSAGKRRTRIFNKSYATQIKNTPNRNYDEYQPINRNLFRDRQHSN